MRVHSDQIANLAAALAAANAELRNPPLDAVNPHFRNRYASLASILGCVRPVLAAHGLSITQPVHTTITEGGMVIVCVETVILHASGEYMRDEIAMPVGDRAGVQQLGSVVTYLRRYALQSCLAIAGEEEDDGEADRQSRHDAAPAPAKRTPPKAAPAPAKPAAAPAKPAQAKPAAPADRYPDAYTGEFTLVRCVERPGQPPAIQVDGEHGTAWITTDQADLIDQAQLLGTAKMSLRRIDGVLHISDWISATPAVVVSKHIPF